MSKISKNNIKPLKPETAKVLPPVELPETASEGANKADPSQVQAQEVLTPAARLSKDLSGHECDIPYLLRQILLKLYEREE